MFSDKNVCRRTARMRGRKNFFGRNSNTMSVHASALALGAEEWRAFFSGLGCDALFAGFAALDSQGALLYSSPFFDDRTASCSSHTSGSSSASASASDSGCGEQMQPESPWHNAVSVFDDIRFGLSIIFSSIDTPFFLTSTNQIELQSWSWRASVPMYLCERYKVCAASTTRRQLHRRSSKSQSAFRIGGFQSVVWIPRICHRQTSNIEGNGSAGAHDMSKYSRLTKCTLRDKLTHYRLDDSSSGLRRAPDPCRTAPCSPRFECRSW